MPVVTFNGPIGAGGNEIGLKVAGLLNADYVDRLILAESAKRIGSSVEVLHMKEQRTVQMRDRIAFFLQTMLERSAMSGAAGEPYFSAGMEYLPSEAYSDLVQEPQTAAQRLNDERVLEVTSAVIKDLAESGNVVIIGRASNIILKDMPGALHVGLVTPPNLRVKTIVERENLSEKEAEKYVTETEKARVMYYKRFFKVDPLTPHQYHLIINREFMDIDTSAEVVVTAARKLSESVVEGAASPS
jgi:cytidylate kinase